MRTVRPSIGVDTYPRVLHVGFTELGAPNSAAITLARAFGSWPEDRILQLCFRPETQRQTVLDTRGTLTRTVETRAALFTSLRTPGGSNTGTRAQHHPVRGSLRAMRDLGPVRVPRAVIDQVTQFSPEVIHSPVWGLRVSRLCLAISRTFDIPIVPHFMDDWPTTAHAGVMMARTVRRQMHKTLRDLLDHSPRLLVVGQLMAEEYTARYDRECDVVGNCVSESDIMRMREQKPAADRTLLYVGGLSNRRSQVIQRVAEHLPEGWQLRLFVNPKEAASGADLARRSGRIEHAGSLNPEDVPEKLGSAAALLFVETDDPDTLAYTRLSVSGKVPEYLLSGRPVVAVGPPTQASIRALQQSPLTTVVSDLAQLPAVVTGIAGSSRSAQEAEELSHVYTCPATQARLLASLQRAVNPGAP